MASWRRLGLGLLVLVGLLLAAVAVNTVRHGSRQLQVAPLPPVAVDEQAVAASLSAAIRARTVSSDTDATQNADQFEALHAHLRARYPRVHATLQREVVGGSSLLYTWPGSDPKAEAVALMAHQDVVPIAPGTESLWQAEPFAGTLRDGFVWGRGAWDDKSNLIAQLEAVEALLGSGFKPSRTIYLIFGADEEVGGARGAQPIAQSLQQRGVRLSMIIDEGLLIIDGVMPGLSRPAALVGLAEKGSVTLRLRADAPAGHSSMPPPPGTGAISRLARALERVDSQPMPGAIDGIAGEMFATVAPEMPMLQRAALSNLWLFGPLLQSQLERGQSTNAMLRTTTALTMVSGGVKENVLPGRAEALVSFRIKPGDTREGIAEHVRAAVADPALQIEAMPGSFPPSRVASTQSAGYQAIHRTLREVAPDVLVAPGLMLGGTDSRHFDALSDSIFKFSPIRAKPDDLARFHGTNERISTASLVEMVRFYHRLLQRSAGQ